MKQRKPLDPLLPGRYGKMTAEEMDREVEKFDREFIAEEARPLDKAPRHGSKGPSAAAGQRLEKGRSAVPVTIKRKY